MAIRALTEADVTAHQPWNAAPLALIYKHSPLCGVSTAAEWEVEAFAAAHPDVPVWRVDVMRQRELSQRLARDLGIRHASPQVILVQDGRATYTDTHIHITQTALEEAVGAACQGA